MDRDALVGAQRPRELAVADIDGDDLAGATAQQHVGEAAGGGAGVEAPASAHRDGGERRERAGQFVAAPGGVARVVVVRQHPDRGSGVHSGGGLAGHNAPYLDPPGVDEAAGLLAGAGEAAPDELGVQSG